MLLNTSYTSGAQNRVLCIESANTGFDLRTHIVGLGYDDTADMQREQIALSRDDSVEGFLFRSADAQVN
jgi:hypothetical protein